MDVNDLKNLSKSVKAPNIPPPDTRGSAEPQNGLIEKLKALEAKEAQQFRKARPLWLLAATCFLLAFLGMLCLPPAGLRPSRLLLGGVLAAVYVMNAILLGRRLRNSLGLTTRRRSAHSWTRLNNATVSWVPRNGGWPVRV